MLTIDQISAHVARLGYRPGWEMTVYQGAHEGTHLVIKTAVEDSYNPGKTVLLDVHSMLPPFHTLEQLTDWILWRLLRLESHECREWFKLDGKPYSDPHADGADQDREWRHLSPGMVDLPSPNDTSTPPH